MASMTIPAAAVHRPARRSAAAARRADDASAAVRGAGNAPAAVRGAGDAPAAVRGAGAVPAAARRPVRLTRRGRRLLRVVVVVVTLLATLVLLSVAGRSGVSQAGDGAATPATTQVVVQPGQTLWGIASSALPGTDAREAVRRVADLNGLAPGARVVPGQPLILPIAG